MTFGGSNVTDFPESYSDLSMQTFINVQVDKYNYFHMHKCEVPLGTRPNAGASLASPKASPGYDANICHIT